jgi:hypothetical protein
VHFDDFVKLLRVPLIMCGERAKPIVIMQAAEKGMLYPVSSKIAIPAGLQNRKGSLALLDKTRINVSTMIT